MSVVGLSVCTIPPPARIQKFSRRFNVGYMLDYVINLLEDTTDFSWASAKASHAVLLCQMEQGGVSGWSDVDKINRL